MVSGPLRADHHQTCRSLGAEETESALQVQGASPAYTPHPDQTKRPKPDSLRPPRSSTEHQAGARGVSGCRLGSRAWSRLSLPNLSTSSASTAYLALSEVWEKIPVHSPGEVCQPSPEGPV